MHNWYNCHLPNHNNIIPKGAERNESWHLKVSSKIKISPEPSPKNTHRICQASDQYRHFHQILLMTFSIDLKTEFLLVAFLLKSALVFSRYKSFFTLRLRLQSTEHLINQLWFTVWFTLTLCSILIVQLAFIPVPKTHPLIPTHTLNLWIYFVGVMMKWNIMCVTHVA